MVRKARRTARDEGAAPAPPPPPPPAPKVRRLNAGAIGRLVDRVKKQNVQKTKTDEAVKRVEETIRQRYIDNTDCFDKDNLLADIITDHRANFKKMDIELSAEHAVATSKLYHLVFHHSNNFLNLFRDIHKAHAFVEDLKRDVQQTKGVIATLSRLTFAKDEPVATGTSGPAAGINSSLIAPKQTSTPKFMRGRASLLVDLGVTDFASQRQENITHQVSCGSYLLAKTITMLPSSSLPPTSVPDDIRNIQLFREIATEEIRQLIGERKFSDAAEMLSGYLPDATEKGLLPVMLELNEELMTAVAEQLGTLPMTPCYFDSLHIPLLRLLAHSGRVQAATEIFLRLHSVWIISELQNIRGSSNPQAFCMIATDMVIALIRHTLIGVSQLAGTAANGTPGLPTAANKSPARTSSKPGTSEVPYVNSSTILWVRSEIEKLGGDVIASNLLSIHQGADAADPARFRVAVSIVSQCVQQVRAIESLGISHSEMHLLRSLAAPLSQLLFDFSRRVRQRIFSTGLALMNAVKIGARDACSRLAGNSAGLGDAAFAQLFDEIVTESKALNRAFVQRLSHFAPSSHLSLLTFLTSPVSSPLFQPLLKKYSSDGLQELLRKGLGGDPYVWASKYVRTIFADAIQSSGNTKNSSGGMIDALQSLNESALTAPQHRSVVVDALKSTRFTTLALQKATDKAAQDRLTFLNELGGSGTTSSSSSPNSPVTPQVLEDLLTRTDIAVPYWSRQVRDVMADALTNRCDQIQASLNSIFGVLRSHAGTNPITQAHRKVVMNVVRGYAFSKSDVPEDLIERMDADHLKWILSPTCDISVWNASGAREYIADVLEAQGNSKFADAIKLLRSDAPVDKQFQETVADILMPMLMTSMQNEMELSEVEQLPSVAQVKSFLAAPSIVAGKWPRNIRIVLAAALERRYKESSSFYKIADITRKLRDPLPLRLTLDDRKQVAVSLSTNTDDHISAALATVGDNSEQEEHCALSFLSADHLSYLLSRSDIGVPYWSRSTRDAFADAIEKLQQKSTNSNQQYQTLISLLRECPCTTRFTTEQRKEIRDVLKKKVSDGDVTTATREIAVQQWTRATPQYVQRLVMSPQSGTTAGDGTISSGACDLWSDAIRKMVFTALRNIIQRWKDLIDLLKQPTGVRVNKDDRTELSKLLQGYTFTAADIAKFATTGSSVSKEAVVKKLALSPVIQGIDFGNLMSRSHGLSYVFHVASSAVLSLLASIRGSVRLPGELDARSTAANDSVSSSSASTSDCASFLLSNAMVAEDLDRNMCAILSHAHDSLQKEFSAFKELASLEDLQTAFRTLASNKHANLAVCRFAECNAPFAWVHSVAFALASDALGLLTLMDFATSTHGGLQLVGEGLPLRTVHVKGLSNSLVTLVRQFVKVAWETAWVGLEGLKPTSQDSSFVVGLGTLLHARYQPPFASSQPDAQTPPRMAGVLLPVDGYATWHLAKTLPRYPHFNLETVDLQDEAFLFHYAVQLSLNLMHIFQDTLLAESSPASRVGGFAAERLFPADGSSMQLWLVSKANSSTNIVTSIAMMQYLLLELIRSLETAGDLASVFRTLYAQPFDSTMKTIKPEIARQLLIFFGAVYYFWVPLFSSSPTSSLFAQGHLSDEPPQAATSTTVAPSSKKTAAAATPTKQPLKSVSEASAQNIDGRSPQQLLASLLDPARIEAPAFCPADPLAAAIVSVFNSIPALQSFATALFSETMKAKVGKLFTKVNLFEFAFKESLETDRSSDEEEEYEESEEDESRGGTEGGQKGFLCLAHVHELLLHYMRPLS